MAEMSQAEILKFAMDNGILNLEHIQEQIDMQKRQDILKNHPYKIWCGKNGKWYTYLPDEKKKIIQRERLTRKAIEDVVVNYWKQFEENPTVKDIFNEYYNQKLGNNEISKATYDRYVLDFNKYFISIRNRRIKGITELDIDNFVHKSIYEFSLSAKRFSGIRTIILAVFKYAKKKQLIDYSITSTMNDIDISRKAFRSTKKSAHSQVFTESELPLMMDYLMDNQDIINLGLLLMYKTGVRIGELATIKRSEVKDYVIPINRTETRYKDASGKVLYEVKDSPKTEAGIRSAIVPTKYEWIIDKIFELNPDGEWLFEKKGNRVKTYSFRKRLSYICKAKLNINPKSPHKIRKTYCTMLLDSKIEDSLITDVVGHTDIKTTKEYYDYDRKSIEEKRKVLDTVKGL